MLDAGGFDRRDDADDVGSARQRSLQGAGDHQTAGDRKEAEGQQGSRRPGDAYAYSDADTDTSADTNADADATNTGAATSAYHGTTGSY